MSYFNSAVKITILSNVIAFFLGFFQGLYQINVESYIFLSYFVIGIISTIILIKDAKKRKIKIIYAFLGLISSTGILIYYLIRDNKKKSKHN